MKEEQFLVLMVNHHQSDKKPDGYISAAEIRVSVEEDKGSKGEKRKLIQLRDKNGECLYIKAGVNVAMEWEKVERPNTTCKQAFATWVECPRGRRALAQQAHQIGCLMTSNISPGPQVYQ